MQGVRRLAVWVMFVLNAATPSLVIDAKARLETDVPVTSGEIGLNIVVDSDADGSLSFALRSETSGEVARLDIVDTQAQGTARIGIEAFAGCNAGPCDDALVIELDRTDSGLDGDLGLTWQLDGLVDTSGDPTNGDLVFDVE